MERINALTSKLFLPLESILNYITNFNSLLTKSDDENLNILLENPQDKVKFQKAIDELLKNSNSPREVILNGKKIKLSI